jgi:hypothetical protein
MIREHDVREFYDSALHAYQALLRVLEPNGRLVGQDWLQRPFGEHVTELDAARAAGVFTVGRFVAQKLRSRA